VTALDGERCEMAQATAQHTRTGGPALRAVESLRGARRRGAGRAGGNGRDARRRVGQSRTRKGLWEADGAWARGYDDGGPRRAPTPRIGPLHPAASTAAGAPPPSPPFGGWGAK
jgi:hypothetical protein